MNAVAVTDLREGDLFAEFSDSRTRETVILPRADIRKMVGPNGKRMQIVHQEPCVAECVTQPNSVHLSTTRGVWCLDRRTVLYRD